jgi:peroxiredoxin
MKRVLFATALGLIALARAGAAEISYPTLPLGAPAPDFNLPGVDGRPHALKDFAAAQVLVVVFTCNHCPLDNIQPTVWRFTAMAKASEPDASPTSKDCRKRLVLWG